MGDSVADNNGNNNVLEQLAYDEDEDGQEDFEGHHRRRMNDDND